MEWHWLKHSSGFGLVFRCGWKERFSRCYGKRHERSGTLWIDRFENVLIRGNVDRRGMVLGSKSLVDGGFQVERSKFGPKWKEGARVGCAR